MQNKKIYSRKSIKLTSYRKLSPARKRLLTAATKKVVKHYKKTLIKLGSS